MKIASVADVKAHFSAYLRDSKSGPIIITKNGKPSAVLLGIDDQDEIERLILAYSPTFQALLNTSRRGIEESGGRAHEEFWEEVEANSD